MEVVARGVAATATTRREREREAVVRIGMCMVSAVQSVDWYVLEVEERG